MKQLWGTLGNSTVREVLLYIDICWSWKSWNSQIRKIDDDYDDGGGDGSDYKDMMVTFEDERSTQPREEYLGTNSALEFK